MLFIVMLISFTKADRISQGSQFHNFVGTICTNITIGTMFKPVSRLKLLL